MLLIFITSCCFAQQSSTITGTVRDSKTKATLPFAIVSIKHTNQATVANEQGSFSFSFIKSDNDTIVFSMFGYEKKESGVNTLLKNDSLKVELDEQVFDLPVTPITGLTAKEVVRKAIKNLNQNFPDTELLIQSFYRQYHKEDNHYVRLIEAIVVTDEKPYRSYISAFKPEKVAITAISRSNVLEENKSQHGDHLIDLLTENPFKFPIGSVLNSKGIDYFNFHFVNSDTGETIIQFSSVLSSQDKIQNGFIFIDEKTFFIKRLITESFPNPNSKVRHFAGTGENYLWKLRNGKYNISYKNMSGVIVYDHIIKSYTHYLFDAKVNSLAHIVEENFELESDKLLSHDENNFHFTSTSNLYTSPYLYNEKDWKYFPTLADEIKKDLEKHQALKQQFIQNGR